MRSFGVWNPSHLIPVPSDTVGCAVLAANAGEAFDWPTGTNVVRLSGATTAGGAYAFVFNAGSTGATWPSSDSVGTTASSGWNAMVPTGGSVMYQISSTASSTGFSVVSPTSGIVTFEFWKRGG